MVRNPILSNGFRILKWEGEKGDGSIQNPCQRQGTQRTHCLNGERNTRRQNREQCISQKNEPMHNYWVGFADNSHHSSENIHISFSFKIKTLATGFPQDHIFTKSCKLHLSNTANWEIHNTWKQSQRPWNQMDLVWYHKPSEENMVKLIFEAKKIMKASEPSLRKLKGIILPKIGWLNMPTHTEFFPLPPRAVCMTTCTLF